MAFKLFGKKDESITVKNANDTAFSAVSENPAASKEENVQESNDENQREGENKYDDDYDDDDNSQCSAKSEWDEGGASHCGYSSMVHNTLMTVGKSVHRVIGDPPERVERGMKSVGGWFQEASYAIRDYTRGNANIEEETKEVVDTIISGGSTLGGSTLGGPIPSMHSTTAIP